MSGKSLQTELPQDKLPAQAKIVIQNVSMGFKIKRSNSDEEKDFQALENVSLTVESGEFLTIVGPSGCGKSTLLDLLAGLTHPRSGKLFIDGKPIVKPALDRGIVLQGYGLLPWRTVQKNVEFGLEIKGTESKKRHEIAEQYIQLVGLQGFEDRYPYELSGGMKQRVSIARALAYDPEVLLMDEPFAAVDAQTRDLMQDELLRIWEHTNKTILFVTHSIEEAVGLADRVAVMSANPGTVREIIRVDLPRPRRISDVRNTADFNRICRRVRDLLENANTGSTKVTVGSAAPAGGTPRAAQTASPSEAAV